MKILVVGDVIFDRYTYVRASRPAREAPMPVWEKVRTTARLGGAGAVAQNLKTLFSGTPVDVCLAGIVEKEQRLQIYEMGVGASLLTGNTTLVKERYVEDKTLRYLFRVDRKSRFPESDVLQFHVNLENHAHPESYDAIVISDYDAGTIDHRTMSFVSQLNSRLRVVYTRKQSISMFRGFDLLKVNKSEAGQIVPQPFEQNFKNVVVTLGSDGSELRMFEGDPAGKYQVHSERFPVDTVRVRDVVGAGDAYLAGLVFSLLGDSMDPRKAVRMANACATAMVQKFGGEPLSLDSL